MSHAASLSRALPSVLAALLTGCLAESRNVQDPMLMIETPAGSELGVSTEYGVLFLGRTARSGEIDITAWFGDGPDIEPSVIEPLGGGLFTAQTEIAIPRVRLTFEAPEPGTDVTILGRRNGEVWKARATVRADPRVEGILLTIPGELEGRENQIGAGVFVGEGRDQKLVGLVSGRLQLSGSGGASRQFLTVMGPDDTWRLVVHNRSIERKQRFIYRDDIL